MPDILSLPPDFDRVSLLGRWTLLDGTPAAGSVTLQPSVPRLVSPAHSTVIMGTPVTLPLDATGAVSAEVPATDDPDITGGPWSYTVTVAIVGASSYSFSLLVPVGSGPIDLSARTPPVEPPPVPDQPIVWSVNARTGHVTLGAEDVEAIPAAAAGAPGGVAELGTDGLVPHAQLPDGGGGEQGPPGADGASAYEVWLAAGNTGTIDDYLDSLVGPPGQDGAPGERGADGAPGASAYEAAVAEGYTGTVEQWLDSLVGPPGQDGAPGEQGPPGVVSGIIDVTAHGATGNGSTNDTPGLQAALNLARDQGGGWVYVPGGTYLIAGTLRIYRRTRLTLAPDATIRRTLPGTMLLNGDAGQNFPGYTGHGDLIIEGGTWDANGVAVGEHSMALSIGHARNVTIRDTRILDVPGYHAIELNSTHTGRVLGVSCLGYVDSVGDRGYSEAIQLDGAHRASLFGGFGPYDGTVCVDITIEGCTIGESDTAGSGPWGRGIGGHSTSPDAPHRGLRIMGNYVSGTREWALGLYVWADVIASGNTIAGCGGGIWSRSLDSSKTADRTRPDGTTIPASQPLSGVVITNNTITDTGAYGAAIHVEGEETGVVSEVVIGDNMIRTTGSTGLRIVYVDAYSIARNVLTDCGNTAVSQLGTRRGLIADNAITNPAGSGVSVDSRDTPAATMTDVIISRNVIRGAGNNGVHVLAGVEIDIGDNRIVDAVGYGIQVSSGAAWCCLKDNRVRGTGSTGLNVTSTSRNMRVQGNDMRTSSIVVPSTDGATSTDRDLSPHNVPQAG